MNNKSKTNEKTDKFPMRNRECQPGGDREKYALVTGASSGIGLSTAEMLLRHGVRVVGIGRDFSRKAFRESEAFNSDGFIQVELDITDEKSLVDKVRNLRKKALFNIVVNAAGTAYYGLHEDLSPEKIHEIASCCLTAPMIITNILLRDLKACHGSLVNVSSVTANGPSPHAAVYGACKAGLSAFTGSLLAECRKSGMKVINIQPDITDTELYRNADFGPDTDDRNAFLQPDDTADAIEYALFSREGMIVTDIRLIPQVNRIKRKR